MPQSQPLTSSLRMAWLDFTQMPKYLDLEIVANDPFNYFKQLLFQLQILLKCQPLALSLLGYTMGLRMTRLDISQISKWVWNWFQMTPLPFPSNLYLLKFAPKSQRPCPCFGSPWGWGWLWWTSPRFDMARGIWKLNGLIMFHATTPVFVQE